MKEFELEPGEKVVREVRKHWFILLLSLLPFIFMALAPFMVHFFLISIPPSGIPAPLAPGYNTYFYILLSDSVTHLLLGLYWLMLWTGAWLTFTRYYLNLWVVTSQRIVDIHQKGFFRREVSSLLLNRVQDITVESEGIIVSLLDIGDINVQSAGAVDRFCMKGIPHPAELRDTILKFVPNIPTAEQSGL